MMSKNKRDMVPMERIQSSILLIRNEKVILDENLSRLYGVATRVLNQAVKRHSERFPDDFMFRLTMEEFKDLKSQIVTSSWGGRRKPPLAFTEQGVAMLSSVLNSKRAIEVNVLIMRAFVRMRKVIASNKALSRRIGELENRIESHDKAIVVLFEEIRKLLLPPPEKPKERIGFRSGR